jgi:hypothetical protein
MPPKVPCPEGDGWKFCPDCGFCKPLAAFSPGASYCKPHAAARAHASRRKALANPESPMRQAKRAADARYRERHAEQRLENARDWKRRNPIKVRAWYKDWVARNPEKRRVSQAAYRARQRGEQPEN